MLPSRAEPRFWGLRARLLAPLLLLMLAAAIMLIIIGDLSARQQADALIRQRCATVIDDITNWVAERQHIQETLAHFLASRPALARAVEQGDHVTVERMLRPLKTQLGLDHIDVYTRDGHEFLQMRTDQREAGLLPLVGPALSGMTRSTTMTGHEGLVIGAATPIEGETGIVGALMASTTLDSSALRAVSDQSVEIVIFRDNGLITTTVTQPDLRALVGTASFDAVGIARLNEALASLSFQAAAAPLGERGTLLVLISTQAVEQAFQQHTMMLLVGTAVVVGSVMLIGLLLVRTISGPIQQMVAITNEMRRGNYRRRVAFIPIRELNELAGAVNHLAAQVELQLAELNHRALHDALTSLPNRVLFMDRLEHALARRQRRGVEIAVMFIDLDNFKIINDSMGHPAGDELLVAVAKRLRTCLRSSDTVARFGGDEFTLLLDPVTTVNDVIVVAERIAERLATPFSVGGHEVFTTASIGIAISTPEHTHAASLLGDSDVAMYQAKASGKALYTIFDRTMNAHTRERLELVTDLRHALERDEFFLVYQPVVTLQRGQLCELEALLRWQHPHRGLLSPGSFIPLAEETGLTVPIGRWVLADVCRQARQWQTCAPDSPLLPISVNLSARQFQHATLVEDITRLLTDNELDPSSLKLEITESAMMREAAATSAKLKELRNLGIQLAMDDFGTGYSSLAYLKRFPIGGLKIDSSFIKGIGQDAEDTAIVRTIITLARTLNLQVTGEGIETAEQAAHLRDLGCHRGQGYYFAPPMSGEEVSALLKATGGLPQLGGGTTALHHSHAADTAQSLATN